jgi:hypothetical protein
LKDLGAAFDGIGHRCKELAHAALWQIHARGTIAPPRLPAMYPENLLGGSALKRNRFMMAQEKSPNPRIGDWAENEGLDYFFSSAAFLHSARNFLRSLP